MPSGKRWDLTGLRFGRLVVLRIAERRRTPNGSVRLMWACQCDCGTEAQVWSVALHSGTTRSCGCLAKELTGCRSASHRMTGSPTHQSWRAMKDRCSNPSNNNFKSYGGRGIGYCESWGTFEGFHADMGDRPEGCTLDRLDNDKGYSKANCRWATPAEQSRNTTRSVLIEWGGVTKNLCDWAPTLGLTSRALAIRISRWGLERAMTTPHRYATK